MDELKVEVALQVIELKIIHLIKKNNENNFQSFSEKLKELSDEREKIYDLDEDVINKVYNVYLEEIKNEKKDENNE